MQALEYQNPRDAARVRRQYVPISGLQLQAACVILAVVLSAASLVVVIQGANDEPYMAYRRSDVVVQVGVATALIVLWCCFASAAALLVATRKLPAAWAALLLWAAVCVFYLSFSPVGYLQDLEQLVVPAARGE